MPTAQETFDFVVKAMIKQGQPSLNGTTCAYRGRDGLKCAAGHLIPDEDYSQDMEGCSCEESLVGEVLYRGHHDLSLVRSLQVAHDQSYHYGNGDWLDLFLHRARRVAWNYGLSPDACNTEAK